MSDFQSMYKDIQTLVDVELERLLPSPEQAPERLHEAMRYSVLAPGKRFRPVLCLATCEALNAPMELALPFACALELIHTYSLVHDDLPSMDNDDLRRGRPTNHKVYGEAIAILAGDALLTLAFEWMANAFEISEYQRIQAVAEIASASGSAGMVGGQVADIESQGKQIDSDLLKYIHVHKTAKLIQASVKAGAIVAGAPDNLLRDLGAYGHFLGLAFQLTDDLLDVEGNEHDTGKAVRKDATMEKATYPSFYGIDNTKKMVHDLLYMAEQSIEVLGGRGHFLKDMITMMQNRKN
ncbi:MAG: polyprenyl synthetase family protein [Chlamydiota bacterium]|nr:polyprenyl synthetase family protein [Chlamydiota bacterium]